MRVLFRSIVQNIVVQEIPQLFVRDLEQLERHRDEHLRVKQTFVSQQHQTLKHVLAQIRRQYTRVVLEERQHLSRHVCTFMELPNNRVSDKAENGRASCRERKVKDGK